MQFARKCIEASESDGNIDDSGDELMYDDKDTDILDKLPNHKDNKNTDILNKFQKYKDERATDKEPLPNTYDEIKVIPVESGEEDLNFFRTLLPYTCHISDEKNLSFRTAMNNLVEKYTCDQNCDKIQKFRNDITNPSALEVDANPDLAFFRTLINYTLRVKGTEKLEMRIKMIEIVINFADLDNIKTEVNYSTDEGNIFILHMYFLNLNVLFIKCNNFNKYLSLYF